MPAEYESCISVANLDLAYGDVVIQRNVTFAVQCGEIFIIMGRSGCGKSTLLRHLIGLHQPVRGEVRYHGESLWGSAETRERLMGRFGVLYQRGALWSSMTLAENVALPLQEFTQLSPKEIQRVTALKLALVGLAGYEAYYPSQLSGGMQKRAGLARAMALDPAILFLDEPSAGLDPVSAKRLDDLILELRDGLAATVVVVTHELASIFGIADRAVFLDAETHTLIAEGKPSVLLQETTHPAVREFLTRGSAAPSIPPAPRAEERAAVPACAGRHPEGAI